MTSKLVLYRKKDSKRLRKQSSTNINKLEQTQGRKLFYTLSVKYLLDTFILWRSFFITSGRKQLSVYCLNFL